MKQCLAMICCFMLIMCVPEMNPDAQYIDAHECSDSTHAKCDGSCECDGMECRYEDKECPNYNTCKGHGVAARDYQINLHMDTVWVYDGDRLVDTYITTWKNQIDTIFLTDNQ